LPSHKASELLGIQKNNVSTAAYPDEYVFCDLDNGAWRCPDITHKTKIEGLSAVRHVATTAAQPSDNPSQLGEKLAEIHFDFDSTKISQDYQKTIIDLIPSVMGKPLFLYGYTDDLGSEAYNDALALARAQNVKLFLIAQGLAAPEIHVDGSGSCCFLVPNVTEAKRRINRRVEFYFAD
jgi:outer membrane protein OmpA-like peptidoglycan-associated protein